MISKRRWIESVSGHYPFEREGWYLFGVFPLYVRDSETRRVCAMATRTGNNFGTGYGPVAS